MMLAAPWALAGLALLALPVAIHLLGLGQARRRQFPSLRFVGETRPLPRRRQRLHDVALLAVRLGVLVAAVLALARPVTRGVPAGVADEPASRAIIVDTSQSVARGPVARAVDSLSATGVAVVIRSAHPGAAFEGAVAWLATQPAPRELVVVSDFQVAAVTRADVDAVPPWIAVRLLRIPSGSAQRAVTTRAALGGATIVARAEVLDDRTTVEWSRDRGAPAAGPRQDDPEMAQTLSVAGDVVAMPIRRTDAGAITLGPAGVTGAVGTQRLAAPWQGDAVVRMARDPLVMRAAEEAPAAPRALASLAVLARNADGAPVAYAASDGANGETLRVGTLSPGQPWLNAALAVASVRAAGAEPPAVELAPAMMPDSLIATLASDATANGPALSDKPVAEASSPARWLWLVALGLLLVEWWVRRRPRAAAPGGLDGAR